MKDLFFANDSIFTVMPSFKFPQPRTRKRPRRIRFELLRERIPFHGEGIGVTEPLVWFDPNALTYSFAPDGTEVAGYASTLSEELASLGSDQQWQATIDHALNAWLSPLGASITNVSDSGAPFGTFGPTQGDSRFGDVRIAAIPMSSHVVATSIPQSAVVQGTWAGDILINSTVDWNILDELHSVILHEFGHVLGLNHSSDPQSAMFSHGIGEVAVPSTEDIAVLQSLYAGIAFEDQDDDEEEDEAVESEFVTQPPFDSAIPIDPVIGSTVRYSAEGLINQEGKAIFRLQPTANEVETLENLTISVMTYGKASPFSELRVFDSAGNEVETAELHHGQGVIVQQVDGFESNETYFVVIENAFPQSSETSPISFTFVGELRPELKLGRRLEDVRLDDETGPWSQSMTVESSRFVHLHIDATDTSGPIHRPTVVVADSENNVVTRVALNSGTQRSAPLALLEPGQYTIHYSFGETGESEGRTKLVVHLDEVSIDVGPSPIDPSGQPYLDCDEPDANPDFCFAYQPLVPETLSQNPGLGPDIADEDLWDWYYSYTCADYISEEFEFVRVYDPEWWDFYAQTCVGVSPTNPTPTNPTPTDPTPTDPTNPAPTTSAWQNPVSPFDVTNDSAVSAPDALTVINAIARNGGDVSVTTDTPVSYADVNGDFKVSLIDALAVINQLSRMDSAVGEGETAAPIPADLLTATRKTAVDSALSDEALLESHVLF